MKLLCGTRSGMPDAGSTAHRGYDRGRRPVGIGGCA